MIALKFGFYPVRCDFDVEAFSIASLPDLDETVKAVRADPGVDKDWIYASPQRTRDMFSDRVTEQPYPSRVFGLPKTHELKLNAQDHARAEFLIWLIGFFGGVRTTHTDAGFLDAAPVKEAKLVDFYCSQRDMQKALTAADAFWVSRPQNCKAVSTLLAAINALWIAHYPQALQFERFTWLYTAIDACWRSAATIHNIAADPPHAKRISKLCELLGLQEPQWPSVVTTRNGLLHEGLVNELPLGFALLPNDHSPGVSPTLQMEAFVCRAIVALMGIPAKGYISSPMDTRGMFGLFNPGDEERQ